MYSMFRNTKKEFKIRNITGIRKKCLPNKFMRYISHVLESSQSFNKVCSNLFGEGVQYFGRHGGGKHVDITGRDI